MSESSWVRVGAIVAGLAVAFGAFGAHGLRSRYSEEVPAEKRLLDNFETAARYQMYHALAIIAVGVLAALQVQGPGRALQVAGWSFLIGVALFSGSLYVLVLTGQRWLGAITPIGGVAFLVGWAALAVAAGTRVRVLVGDGG